MISASYKKDLYEKWKSGRQDLFEEDSSAEAEKSKKPKDKLTILRPQRHSKVHPILTSNGPVKGEAKNEVHQLDRRLKIRKTQNKKRAFVKWRKGVNEQKRKKFMREVRKKNKNT